MLGGKMGNLGKMAFLAILFTAFQHSAALGNTLEEINYSVLSGGRVQIALKTSEPVSDPSSFATDNPARIAIDLPNTRSGLAVKTKTIGSGVARSVTALEAGGKTRVVINLLDTAPFEMSTDGNQILVLINAAAGSASSAVSSGGVTRSNAGHQITGVDFRRGEQGVAKVEVSLSDPNVIVDMRKRGKSVVLDFMDTSVSSSQARTLDVTDFATSVKSIQTRPNRKNTRMTIATQGEFEHLAYQANNLYTIEFRQLTKQEKRARQKQQLVYSGDKLSLNFQDIEVRSVLQLLADFTGLNMVVSDTVGGRITLRLKNVPWDQAMDIILKTKGLSQRRTNNVVLVAPTEEIAAREKLELESQRQVEELAPMHSELIQIKYATASKLAELLKTEDNHLMSDRGNVTVDDRTNSLLVQDTSAKLEEINSLIEALDVPVRQVLVESRIVIANDDFARDLGVRFGFNRDYANSDDKVGLIAGGKPGYIAGTAGYAGPTGGIENPGGSEMEALMVNLPSVLGGDRGGAINFLVGKVGSYLVQLELSAMQQEGKGEIVSSPRVITSDQSKATILQGQEIPYQEASSSGATSVTFKEAVLKLEVTPHITPDDRIMMDLHVTKDNPDWSRTVLGVPPIDTRQVETSVLVDNGETVVLGGIIERNFAEDEEKIPWFGDLPLLGWAFRQKTSWDQNVELLIFITPKILKESMSLR